MRRWYIQFLNIKGEENSTASWFIDVTFIPFTFLQHIKCAKHESLYIQFIHEIFVFFRFKECIKNVLGV